MKCTILAAATALAITALADERRLVTVVTSPEPQTQLMAMVLTMQAVRQDAAARILLCGPGGDLALADAPDVLLAGIGVAAPPEMAAGMLAEDTAIWSF